LAAKLSPCSSKASAFFWRAIALAFADFDPSMTAVQAAIRFSIEPRSRWQVLNCSAVTAAKAGAAAHAMIAQLAARRSPVRLLLNF
jgi:hypothetical protein